MSLMDKLEYAVGNEYLVSHKDLFLNINQSKQRQANANKIVSIQKTYKLDNNTIENQKRINA
ncbi:hypothetical protein [Legionella pneumophila]|uniref:hypothetical protein n=1 Tax=Legionella pneumophila TaxID=446 RepID=UPI0007708A4E|nr:hypothetical protein [Legionella pneumophila]AOU05314.1 hypothetical protein A9E97_11615 [Legionella pneumophila]AOU29120.1 hypothetical protein A9E78_11625 [Legionella pneumophila]AOU32100.1 hypothetical protein A9E79_11810 [Legionella pneumophila]AOU35066.1 hypothetical protein A9E80_11630 [Legionella pneumophila]AOU38027.1 hypothetical protein A9E81_11635 [Legionella pneumophila]